MELKTYKLRVTGNRTLKAEFKKLASPVVYTLPAGYNKVQVKWSAVPGASYYSVYAAIQSSDGSYPGIFDDYVFKVTTNQLGFTDQNLIYGKNYRYLVRAFFSSEGIYGPPGSAIAVPRLVLTTSVYAVPTGDAIKVTWTPIEGATSYQLYRKNINSNIMYLIHLDSKGRTTFNSSMTSYIDKDVEMGETYCYILRAMGQFYYSSGKERKKWYTESVDSWSNYRRLVPGTPTLSAARSSNRKSVSLSWSSAVGADRYEIYSALLGQTLNNMIRERYAFYHSYTNSGLYAENSYCYKVRAYAFDANGNKVYGGYSNVANVN